MHRKFTVHRRRIKVADYGSPSHRKRIVLVCTRREASLDVVPWEMPPPSWGAHRPLCAADVALLGSEVPEEKKCFTEPLQVRYNLDCCQPTATFGEMMRVGRVAPGMGLSWNPHLCLGWHGVFNGPTGYGVGGTFPPREWFWGHPIPWRRKPLTKKFYRVAGSSETLLDLHQSYGLPEDALVQAVNHDFPTAVSWALDTSLGQWLHRQGAAMDIQLSIPISTWSQRSGTLQRWEAWRAAALPSLAVLSLPSRDSRRRQSVYTPCAAPIETSLAHASGVSCHRPRKPARRQHHS